MKISSEDEHQDEDDSFSQSLPSDSSFLMEEALTASNEWLLKFDVVTESAYLPGKTNDIFHLNLRMRLGGRFKQYEIATGGDQSVVGVQINAPGFTIVLTPEQISGRLTRAADCKEFAQYYADMVNLLIPREGFALASLDKLKTIEKDTLYVEGDLSNQQLNYVVIDPAGGVVKGYITVKELPSLQGKLDDPVRLLERLQPLLSDILIITSEKKHTTLKFKNMINVFSKCRSGREVVEVTRQSILAKIQQGRAVGSYVICETSPSKLTHSQSAEINIPIFVPKLIASIMISVDSLDESLTPRLAERQSTPSPRTPASREVLSGTSGGSPRPTTSSTGITSSSPRESSPRQNLARQTSTSRFLCFFKGEGSNRFIHKEPAKRTIFTRKVSDLSVPARPSLPTIELSHSPVEQSGRALSPKSSSYTESSTPLKFTQHSICVRKSSVGGNSSGDLSTEIKYSPRERSSSSPRPQSPSQVLAEKEYCKDILIYCQDQIVQWCGDHALKYERTKYSFTVHLNDHDVLIIQGNNIKINNLEIAAISLMIDLLHRLDFVEDISIRHDSLDPAVDLMIVSGLTASPRRNDVEKVEEIQALSPPLL